MIEYLLILNALSLVLITAYDHFSTLTKRDKKELRVNNHLFHFNNTKNGKVYWVCKQSRTQLKCKSRCITDESGELTKKPTVPHNHEPYHDDHFAFAGFVPQLKQKSVFVSYFYIFSIKLEK
jgi:hypothetical protein